MAEAAISHAIAAHYHPYNPYRLLSKVRKHAMIKPQRQVKSNRQMLPDHGTLAPRSLIIRTQTDCQPWIKTTYVMCSANVRATCLPPMHPEAAPLPDDATRNRNTLHVAASSVIETALFTVAAFDASNTKHKSLRVAPAITTVRASHTAWKWLRLHEHWPGSSRLTKT